MASVLGGFVLGLVISSQLELSVLYSSENQTTDMQTFIGPIVAVLMFQTGGKLEFSRQQKLKTDELLQKQPAKKILFV